MGKRNTIGIVYAYNEDWIGGTYYVENLVHSFLSLEISLQPNVWLLNYSPLTNRELAKRINYDRIKIVKIPKYSWWRKILVRMSGAISFSTLPLYGRPNVVDLTFPNPYLEAHDLSKNRLYWIPDLQELQYPDLFSGRELERRRNSHLKLIEANSPIVFSSQSALSDFLECYRPASFRPFLLPFAVTLPDYQSCRIDDLRKEFGLGNAPYFICSNQFWKHKNHALVLRTLPGLIRQFPEVLMVFTGQPKDTRNESHFESLIQMVNDLRLEKSVRFLGFIDRAAQLALMKESVAIVQPSLFEGWSTVVEDAKCLNKEIILSDIAVHREQLPLGGGFFDPASENALLSVLTRSLNGQLTPPGIDYQLNVNLFARSFLSIVADITKS